MAKSPAVESIFSGDGVKGVSACVPCRVVVMSRSAEDCCGVLERMEVYLSICIRLDRPGVDEYGVETTFIGEEVSLLAGVSYRPATDTARACSPGSCALFCR